MQCKKCGNQINDINAEVCPQCGAPLHRAGDEGKIPIYGITNNLPMTWYKFLIYFSLIFSAVMSLGDSWMYFTGRVWDYMTLFEHDAAYMYAGNPGLMTVDRIMGVMQVLAAGYCIFVRFSLAKFQKKGPLLLYVLYALNQLIQIGYTLSVAAITDLVADYGQIGAMLFAAAVVIWLNVIYFKKRKDMFIS